MSVYKNKWTILCYLVVGAFLSPLDYFIVNMALPLIEKSYKASESQLQMVIAIYGLTYPSLVVCSGKLGDIYGRRRIFVIGLWTFLFSSLGCALSPSINFLLFFRFLQGLGASLLAPQVLASIKVIFDEPERTKALGIFGSVFGLAAIISQLLGGILLGLELWGLTWELIFLVNIPIAATCLYGVYTNMPKERIQRQGIDFWGIVLVVSSLVCFITRVVYGRGYDWAWWIFVIIGLSFLLLVLFFNYEQNREKQGLSVLLEISLLKSSDFSRNLPLILFYNFTAGLFICYPYYLQIHLGWTVLASGLAILPYGAGFFLGPLLFAKWNRKNSFWIQLGLGLLSGSFVLLALLFGNYDTPNSIMHALFLFAGLGHGVLMPSMMKESIGSVANKQIGAASGIISTVMQVGSVLGGGSDRNTFLQP
ncbi:MAG: MFS transporter [Sphingobacterium sp.]|jgi:MFS family permease|nr:MFS transporter [Sphingobacterium sp.]